jgi:hypothetical protein
MTTDADHSWLEAALAYAARGWCVLPLYGVSQGRCSCAKGAACTSPGKHPLIDDWPHTASLDPAQIEAWGRQWPAANVGVLTGVRSHLAVLDTDPRHGGRHTLADLEACHTPLPETPMVMSGGADRGDHRYFFLDGPLGKYNPGAGLNLQADEAYVVAPPSQHASGRLYMWEASSEPDDLPLAALPDWLKALGQDHAAAVAAAVTLPDELPAVDIRTLQVSTRIKYIIQTGEDPQSPTRFPSRSEALFTVLLGLVGAGCDDATIAAVVMNRRYAISEKVWDQKNPKSPTYESQTRQWLAGDIGRARAAATRQPADQEPPAPPDIPDDPAEMDDLLRRAQAQAKRGRNGQTPGPEPTDPYACPALPDYACTQDEWADGASLFLDDFITISAKWAPRAYAGFHEAVALFLLSTIAARRVKILFGPRGVYTSLYIALAARTTIYTKSTVVDMGLALLEAAGLLWLLADDESTPQAFLRSLTRYVPSNYDDLPPEEQASLRRKLAFSAQTGWFYEEFGQHLEAMMQKNGYMASFRSILRRMDDHKARYVYHTIARGRDIIHKPYISLLANVTPSDLQPFVKARSSLWRDGYIARLGFVTPEQGEGSDAPFPEGTLAFPSYMVSTLQKWHQRLGVPACILTPTVDKKGDPTGGYTVDADPLPEKVYTLSPDVRTAYYAYDQAMRELTRSRQNEDLDGSYGRFPMKALRIAGLLAALHDDSGSYTIWPAQWWRGQQIAERWRRDLHRLMQQVREDDIPTREGKGEQRVLTVLRKHGPMSAIEIHRWTKLAHTDILQHLDVLQRAGAVREQETGRTTKYGLVAHGQTP